MDPILDLSSLGKRAQIRDAAWIALMTILGGPADLEDFYAIPKEMLLAGLQAFEFKPDADQPGEKLTLVQIGRLSQCYDTRPSAKPDPVSSLANTTHDAAVQLKHVVNESMEGFVKRPDSDDMTKLLLIYQSRCGGLPRDEIEPTPDQIGALRQILDSGAPPSVDMCIWGPHQKRAIKKLQLSATLYDPTTSRWVQRSLRGPPSFDVWLKCWSVFKVAMIMLEQASTASLDLYEARIREFATETYPNCWFLVYQADTRCRSELFEKILRATEIEHAVKSVPGFDKKCPWDYVIKQAVNDEYPKTMAWWNKELSRKCDGYINQTMSYSQVVDDGSTLLVSGRPDWGKRPAQDREYGSPSGKKHKKGKGKNQPNNNNYSPARSPPGTSGWPKGDKGVKGKGGGEAKGKGKGQEDKGKGKGQGDKGKGKSDKGKGKGNKG